MNEEQLLEVLEKTNFDVIRAERQIKQDQADRLENGLKATKTIPKKQYYTVRRDHDANPEFIREDMALYSDFELHELCRKFKSLNKFVLTEKEIVDSGKLKMLDDIHPPLKEKKQKVLFSQFCITLDIIEVYMQLRGYKYMRLDGSTKVDDRLTVLPQR